MLTQKRNGNCSVMNIRISKNQLRFRITKDEFLKLIGGEDIVLESPIDLGLKSYSVCLSQENEKMNLMTKLNHLILFINVSDLEDLKLPSKSGIENEVLINGRMIKLALEVDVKNANSDNRRKK